MALARNMHCAAKVMTRTPLSVSFIQIPLCSSSLSRLPLAHSYINSHSVSILKAPHKQINEICIVDTHHTSAETRFVPKQHSSEAYRSQKACSSSISAVSTPAEEGGNFAQDNDTALVEGLSQGVTLDSQADPLY